MPRLGPPVCLTAFAAEPALAWHPRPARSQLLQGPATRAARAVGLAAPARSGRDLYALVSAAAARHGVPARLAHAIVRIESGYRCGARGAGGSLGLMQVLPRTAASVGVAGNLLACDVGLEAGLRYLRLALAAGGPGCAGASLYNLGVAARPRCTAYGRRAMALAGGVS